VYQVGINKGIILVVVNMLVTTAVNMLVTGDVNKSAFEQTESSGSPRRTYVPMYHTLVFL